MEVLAVILSIATIFGLAMTFILMNTVKSLLKYVAILLEEIAFDKEAENIYSKIKISKPSEGHKRNLIADAWEH